jgi:hypothetical protein
MTGNHGGTTGRIARTVRRIAGVALLAAIAAGCASTPTMQGEVTRFHAWQAAEPLTFAFAPTPQQAGSLEHRSYEQLVRDRLATHGFAEAPAQDARYRVTVEYQAIPEPRRVTDWYTPGGWYGPPGMGWGAGPWIGPRPFSPFWRYDPWWGWPPLPVSYDVTVVRHELRLGLFDVRVEPPPGRKVWESRSAAIATGESMPRLMPGLVEAALADFPGESGATRRVEVPLPSPPDRR